MVYLPAAACSRAQNELALAEADLAAAREFAERGDMKLFLADYHLEAGCAWQRAESLEQRAKGIAQRAKEKRRRSILPLPKR